MIRSSKGKLLVFSVFLLGIGSGGVAAYEYDTRVREPRQGAEINRTDRVRRAQQDVSRFHDYLGLTSEQREQVNKLLEDNREEFRHLQEMTRPQFEALQQQTQVRIRALLNDEQKKKYDDFNTKRQRGQRPRIE